MIGDWATGMLSESLPLVPGIFGYPAGTIGIGIFTLGYPQAAQLSGKSEPYLTPISTSFFVGTVVKVCLSTYSLVIILARAVSQEIFQEPSPERPGCKKAPGLCRKHTGSTEE
jgi:hypothetical protein